MKSPLILFLLLVYLSMPGNTDARDREKDIYMYISSRQSTLGKTGIAVGAGLVITVVDCSSAHLQLVKSAPLAIIMTIFHEPSIFFE